MVIVEMLKVSKVVQYGTGQSTEPKVAFKLPVDLLSRLSQRPSGIYEYELICWKGGIRIGIIFFGKVENTHSTSSLDWSRVSMQVLERNCGKTQGKIGPLGI